MTNASFTASDIKNVELLEIEIEHESIRLFESDRARKGRTFEAIKTAVRQGKTLEVWLTENYDFKLSSDKYHDLIDSEGNFVEVKAYNIYSSNAPSVQNDIYRIRTGGWNQSKYYIIFRYDNGTYTFLEKIMI